MVAIKGEERGVNAIPRARFKLDTDLETRDRYDRGLHQSYSMGVVCLFLFTTGQLLVPQGTVFGQIMFIVSQRVVDVQLLPFLVRHGENPS